MNASPGSRPGRQAWLWVFCVSFPSFFVYKQTNAHVDSYFQAFLCEKCCRVYTADNLSFLPNRWPYKAFPDDAGKQRPLQDNPEACPCRAEPALRGSPGLRRSRFLQMLWAHGSMRWTQGTFHKEGCIAWSLWTHTVALLDGALKAP